MEPRLMLSADPLAGQLPQLTVTLPITASIQINNGQDVNGVTTDATGLSSPYGGLTPAQMRGAYGANNINFDGIVGDGTGQTIAIIDAYDDPAFVNSTASNFSSSDLALFDAKFGLPNPPSFTKYGVNESGTPVVSTTLPGTDPTGPYHTTGTYSSAVIETSLDVEWAHVMAPEAKIVLIETNTLSDLYDGIEAANNLGGVNVISMSFAGDENQLESLSNEEDYNAYYFQTPGITYVNSAGDFGVYNEGSSAIEPEFPDTSEDILSVGGTTLSVSGTSWAGETTWGNGTSSYVDSGDLGEGGGGGGISLYEPRPSYQTSYINASNRNYPDISLEGNDNPGVPILDSWDGGTGTGWFPGLIGGTSLAAPMMAGLVADADQGRALAGLPTLNSNGIGGVDIHTLLYSLAGNATTYAADFHDITGTASIGPSPTYSPEVGYDLASGLGTPIANNLVFDLTGISGTALVNQPPLSGLYFKQDATSTKTDVWVDSVTPGVGTPTYVFNDADETTLLYTGGGSSNRFTLDLSAGTTFVSGLSSITDNGPFDGANFLQIDGTASSNDAIVATSANISIGSTVVVFTNQSTLTLSPGAGTDTLAVNSGTWNIAAPAVGAGIVTRNFSALSVAAAAVLKFGTAQLHTDRLLVEAGTFSVLGKLDLGGNDMIIHNGNLASITALLTSGYADGLWTGTGISSAAAAANTTHLTALGVIQNSVYGGAGQPLFDGTSPVTTDVLVKYTYYGDANLDGKVDGTDYGRIDNGHLAGLTGWFNGDFNYDSGINGSDYSLIDNAYNTQRASLSAEIASQISTGSEAPQESSTPGSIQSTAPAAASFPAIQSAGSLSGSPWVDKVLADSGETFEPSND